VALHCVIRKAAPVGHQFANPAESLICTKDDHKVHGVIKESMADAQSWEWVKSLDRAQDRRGAVTFLQTHFDGPGEVEKRVAHALDAMEGLHCRKESVLTEISRVGV
jgi:N-acetylglucosamine-6-phosphate deacetylase